MSHRALAVSKEFTFDVTDCQEVIPDFEHRDGVTFYKRDHVQFVRDMDSAGLTVYYARGRWLWRGPAVRVRDISQAIIRTRVLCQWEDLGSGWFAVYPSTSM